MGTVSWIVLLLTLIGHNKVFLFRSFINGGILSDYKSLLALCLGGTPSLKAGIRPPSCLLLENWLYMSPDSHMKLIQLWPRGRAYYVNIKGKNSYIRLSDEGSRSFLCPFLYPPGIFKSNFKLSILCKAVSLNGFYINTQTHHDNLQTSSKPLHTPTLPTHTLSLVQALTNVHKYKMDFL